MNGLFLIHPKLYKEINGLQGMRDKRVELGENYDTVPTGFVNASFMSLNTLSKPERHYRQPLLRSMPSRTSFLRAAVGVGMGLAVASFFWGVP